MKVLVVEDEKRILQFVTKGLEEAGFSVDGCETGDEGLLRATTQSYDAIVLDIMLPGRDGLSVLRQVREKKNAVPVILLTARTALDERVEGLNLGADDYLTKPFYVEELIARLHALGRRTTGQSLTVVQAGDLPFRQDFTGGSVIVRIVTAQRAIAEEHTKHEPDCCHKQNHIQVCLAVVPGRHGPINRHSRTPGNVSGHSNT